MSKLIYFIRPIGHVGPIKIGCSVWPEGRLATQMIWSPLPLEIVATVPGTHADECALHSMFHKQWLHCEWFTASRELLALLRRVVDTGRLPPLRPAGKFHLNRLPRQSRAPEPICPRTIEFGRFIAAEYEAGATMAELASKYGRSPTTINRALHGAGIKVRPGGARKGSQYKPRQIFAEAA